MGILTWLKLPWLRACLSAPHLRSTAFNTAVSSFIQLWYLCIWEFLKVSPVKSSMTCNPHISLGSSRAPHFEEAQGIWSLMQRLTMLCKSPCILTPYCYSFPISHHIYIYIYIGGHIGMRGFEVLSISRHRA